MDQNGFTKNTMTKERVHKCSLNVRRLRDVTSFSAVVTDGLILKEPLSVNRCTREEPGGILIVNHSQIFA